ncbi:MAG: hypothetical protein PHG51_07745, partial [Candidatus Omnitrophica bacterium]|nr:hypothetical protein [Candidatus Omnitrophota bacterium]
MLSENLEDIVQEFPNQGQKPYVFAQLIELPVAPGDTMILPRLFQFEPEEIMVNKDDFLPIKRLFDTKITNPRIVFPVFPTVYSPATEDHFRNDFEYMRAVLTIGKDSCLQEGDKNLIVGVGSGFDSWLAWQATHRPVFGIGINPLEVANTLVTAKQGNFRIKTARHNNIISPEGTFAFPGLNFQLVSSNAPFYKRDKSFLAFMDMAFTKLGLLGSGGLIGLWDGDRGKFIKGFAQGLHKVMDDQRGIAVMWNRVYGEAEIKETLAKNSLEIAAVHYEEEDGIEVVYVIRHQRQDRARADGSSSPVQNTINTIPRIVVMAQEINECADRHKKPSVQLCGKFLDLLKAEATKNYFGLADISNSQLKQTKKALHTQGPVSIEAFHFILGLAARVILSFGIIKDIDKQVLHMRRIYEIVQAGDSFKTGKDIIFNLYCLRRISYILSDRDREDWLKHNLSNFQSKLSGIVDDLAALLKDYVTLSDARTVAEPLVGALYEKSLPILYPGLMPQSCRNIIQALVEIERQVEREFFLADRENYLSMRLEMREQMSEGSLIPDWLALVYDEIQQYLQQAGYALGQLVCPFSGGDILTPLALSDAVMLRFYDPLDFGFDVDSVGLGLFKDIYFSEKALMGSNSYDLLFAIGSAKVCILWELEAMGATEIKVEKGDGEDVYYIDFTWSKDGISTPSRRRIIYTQKEANTDIFQAQDDIYLSKENFKLGLLKAGVLPRVIIAFDDVPSPGPEYKKVEIGTFLETIRPRLSEEIILLMGKKYTYEKIQAGKLFIENASSDGASSPVEESDLRLRVQSRNPDLLFPQCMGERVGRVGDFWGWRIGPLDEMDR